MIVSSRSVRRVIAGIPAIAVACAVLSATASAQEWTFGADRIVAISDVHGDYDAMSATLAQADVIDAAGHWAAGETALVITGDLLDRGPDSRKVMDLIMALEDEARTAGGAVHLLVGNHEVMNLVGDLRYVATEEYAAFAADEDPAERDAAFARYLEDQVAVSEDAARADFDERYPAGFFAHRRAFRSDGRYGAWLLSKPVIVVGNGTAFTHGGLSPEVADLGLEGINDGLMGEVRTYVESLATVVDAGLIDPAANFYQHASLLESVDTDGLDPDVAAAVESVLSLNRSRIHASDSPLWYRGNVGCGELIEYDRLLPVLESIGARRVVVGHTPTSNRKVLSRLDGRVIEIDTGMLSAYYQGSGYALVLEGDDLTVLPELDGGAMEVMEHPRRVGIRRSALSEANLERLLAEGTVTLGEAMADGRISANVVLDDRRADAVFIPDPGEGLSPDFAAYRLDRFLGLDMVPVTARRTIDGDEGSLQFLPESTTNEEERRAAGLGGSAWCPLPEQWGAMYVFDALIHNPGRAQDRMLYSRDNWQLILVGHDVSFETSRSRPGYLRELSLPVGRLWVDRLGALSEDVVDEMFADTLDRRRRRALSARRDRLLRDAEE